jgi:glutamate synthase domain-containing protein 2
MFMAPSQNSLREWDFLGSGERKAKSTMTILTPEAERESNLFKESMIYPQILRGWKQNDNHLMNEFLEFSSARFSVSEKSLETFQNEFQSMEEHAYEREQLRAFRDKIRIEHAIDEWNNMQKDLQDQKEQQQQQSRLNAPNYQDRQANESKLIAFKCQEFVPYGMITTLVQRCRLEPSQQLFHALRVIAYMMVRGDIKPTDTPDQIMEYIISRGGYGWLVRQPVHQHIV